MLLGSTFIFTSEVQLFAHSAESRPQPNKNAIPSYDFFAGIPEIKNDFLTIATEKILQKKEFLFLDGDFQNSAFYLVEGWMTTTRIGQNGKELIVDVLKPGWIVGPTGRHYPRATTCQALTKCRLLEATIGDWKRLFVRHPYLYERLLIHHHRIAVYLLSLYSSAFVDDAETRLKKLLARTFCEQLINSETDISARSVPINMSQEQLASGSGISRIMANRILHQMQEEGLLTIKARKIYMINPSQLLSYLEHKT